MSAVCTDFACESRSDLRVVVVTLTESKRALMRMHAHAREHTHASTHTHTCLV